MDSVMPCCIPSQDWQAELLFPKSAKGRMVKRNMRSAGRIDSLSVSFLQNAKKFRSGEKIESKVWLIAEI
jgi:hypothetical protein